MFWNSWTVKNRNKKPCNTCCDSDESCVQIQTALDITSLHNLPFLISIIHYLTPQFLHVLGSHLCYHVTTCLTHHECHHRCHFLSLSTVLSVTCDTQWEVFKPVLSQCHFIHSTSATNSVPMSTKSNENAKRSRVVPTSETILKIIADSEVGLWTVSTAYEHGNYQCLNP
jgi:hypothetical protein